MKINNKGQALVLFVLILPIIFLLLVSIIDIGKMSNLKNKLTDICNIAIDYGLDNLSDPLIYDKINELIIKNDNNIDDIDIKIIDNKIYITLTDNIDDKFIDKYKIFYVKVSFVGYIDNSVKIIERNK